MAIEVLPPEVAAKIAAGEVVERPASAVKELIENAIDAGATDIRIEIRDGGKRLIRVADNGCGIAADQASLAFARHATSKLHTLEDLDRIATLGFRGEALASIAAVSQVTMTTCARDEAVGTLLRLEGGQVVRRESHGCPPGTTITVENLFYNTPARRKFLRSDATENAVIADLVTSYALAYPEIRFTMLNNDRLTFQTAGTGKLYDVLIKTYGLANAEKMIEFQEESEGLSLRGYISPPSLYQANRKGLLFFVNRRWVQDRSLSYAVEEAYHDLLPAHRYPLVVMDIRLHPAEVDVNIHPTKREIRFRDARRVFAAVQRTVRHVLQKNVPIPVAQAQPTTAATFHWELPSQAMSRYVGQRALDLQRTEDRLTPALTQQPTSRLPMLRVVGQLAQTYIIAEGPGGMYLIDQHAAHERVVYEELCGRKESNGAAGVSSGGKTSQIASQALLEPLVIELTPSQSQVLEAYLPEMPTLGFAIVPFGVNAYRVQAVPTSLVGNYIASGEIAATIVEMVEQAEGGNRPWKEEALITIACHSAVRAGQTLSMPEMRDLVRQLEETSTPHSCPHGRPTMIHFSAAQLEREFNRR